MNLECYEKGKDVWGIQKSRKGRKKSNKMKFKDAKCRKNEKRSKNHKKAGRQKYEERSKNAKGRISWKVIKCRKSEKGRKLKKVEESQKLKCSNCSKSRKRSNNLMLRCATNVRKGRITWCWDALQMSEKDIAYFSLSKCLSPTFSNQLSILTFAFLVSFGRKKLQSAFFAQNWSRPPSLSLSLSLSLSFTQQMTL